MRARVRACSVGVARALLYAPEPVRQRMACECPCVCVDAVNEQLTSPEAKNTVSSATQAPITMSSRNTIRGCCWLIQ